MKGTKMPVKEKVNKSAEIRRLHASGVKSASEIVAQLKSKGIKTTPTLVYNVLAKKKAKKKKKAKQVTSSEVSPLARHEVIIDHAVQFVRISGGMQKAKELLSKLSSLHN
jgi:predicted transcriptional regulator